MAASRRTVGLALLAAAGLSGCARREDSPLATRYPQTDAATWGAHAWGVLRWGMGPGDADLALQREQVGGTFAALGAIGQDPRGQRYALVGSSVAFGGTPSVVDLLFVENRLFEIALWAAGPRDFGPLVRWQDEPGRVAWAAFEEASVRPPPPPVHEAAPPESPRAAERRAVHQLAVVLRTAAWERRVYGRASTDVSWARDEFLSACGARATPRACRTRLALVEKTPERFVAWDGRWSGVERPTAHANAASGKAARRPVKAARAAR